MMEGGALKVEGNSQVKGGNHENQRAFEIRRRRNNGVLRLDIEMNYCFDKNSSLSEADMEVLNMEPSKIWGWDDGTICVEVKING
jgi:hypothetical protein|nr:MAG TPA: hypothetical protein [Caudoviricetes sp.]